MTHLIDSHHQQHRHDLHMAAFSATFEKRDASLREHRVWDFARRHARAMGMDERLVETYKHSASHCLSRADMLDGDLELLNAAFLRSTPLKERGLHVETLKKLGIVEVDA